MIFKIGDKVAISQNSRWAAPKPYLILEITGETKTQWRLEDGTRITKDRLKIVGTDYTYAQSVTDKILSYNEGIKAKRQMSFLKDHIIKALDGVKTPDQMKTIHAAIVQALANTTEKESTP
jgi:hypothetical protein